MLRIVLPVIVQENTRAAASWLVAGRPPLPSPRLEFPLMGLLGIVLVSSVVLGLAYVTYGNLLVRLLKIDPKAITPAVELRDDLDYEPIAPSTLFPQHFSAIAAAGPIVGPILACKMFGWLPALIWILVGAVLIGGVHDFFSLIASVRHKARSIAEVVRDYMSPLSYLLFLTFIWIALVYIIVAFTDITSSSFVGPPSAESGGAGGGAVATSSLLYLVLPILLGLLLRYAKLPLGPLTAVFIVLVGLAIWVGPKLPFDVATMINVPPSAAEEENIGKQIQASAAKNNITLTDEELATKVDRKRHDAYAQKIWNVALLVYCLVAGVVPVWLLLQPRGHLGGYFLYFALGAGALGLAFGGLDVKYPAFRGWEVTDPSGNVLTLFPFLFILIACGACSGFHSLIASGTTSKQLSCEPDAKSVGYGAMLLEGMVAIVSLCCVAMFAIGSPELNKSPNQIYAEGIAKFASVIRVDPQFARAFALMAFTTFVYDTLDVCTRLGRFIIQELFSLHNWFGRFLGTALTAGVPLFFLLRHPVDAPKPVYEIFWQLFGASNQLLAALTLLGLTVWLWRTRQEWWIWPVVGAPAVWMYAMSTWALTTMTSKALFVKGSLVPFLDNPVPYIGIVLLSLAAVMLLEAIRVILFAGSTSGPTPQPALSTAS